MGWKNVADMIKWGSERTPTVNGSTREMCWAQRAMEATAATWQWVARRNGWQGCELGVFQVGGWSGVGASGTEGALTMQILLTTMAKGSNGMRPLRQCVFSLCSPPSSN